ncbi:MAG: HAD-IG family 5'-nucleotidase [bacterium]
MDSALPAPRTNDAPAPSAEFRASPGVHPPGVPREARIFVNRHLRMSRIGAVGFDLDYTLANYRVRELDELAFRLTREKLVEKRGYPAEILTFALDSAFVRRGLVLDTRRGNLLKMDYHNYVVRASHGTRPISSEERKGIYRTRRLRTSAEAYVSVDTHFHLPEVYLYLLLVDFFEDLRRPTDFHQMYKDVRAMIDEAHADGSIKREIVQDPGRFLEVDPYLPQFLASLRAEGKTVFLLTNSEYYYTDVLLNHLLPAGETGSWRDYFDLVVVDAKKPGFFTGGGRPEKWIERGPGTPIRSGGDVEGFEREIGFQGDRILYWGDHTYGDILRSKKSVGWRTAMIIPELADELLVTERIRPDLGRLDAAIEDRDRVLREQHLTRTEIGRLNWLLAGSSSSADEARAEVLRKRTRLEDRLAQLETERVRLHDRITSLNQTCNGAYDSRWGPLFREGNEITRFGHQVRDFACIYTSRVTNLLHYPLNTYWRAPMERMPHER